MKTIIYQCFPRYWGNYSSLNVRGGSLSENGCGHFGNMDDASLEYIRDLGCTHVWYTGVIRHSTSCDSCGCTPSHPQIVKGKAGSPYAITDYYDVNPYLADNPDDRMMEFEELVRRTHKHGLKVILDFVPNHVSRDNVNFGSDDDKSVHWSPENDFFYYPGERLSLPDGFVPDARFSQAYCECPARATGNNCFSPCTTVNDWYETVKLNYCDFRTGTWDKMKDILEFWVAKGVDGFRCDMVELVPPEFFEWLIPEMKASHPGLMFVAEVYKKELYHKYIYDVGFDLLYDKSGLYDSLRAVVEKNVKEGNSPVMLWQSARNITYNWQFLQDLQPSMLNFLENHDEQRIASDFFAGNASKCYAAMAVSLLFNNAAFMLYQGQETGERGMYEEGFSGRDGRSTIFDWWKPSSLEHLWNHIHCGSGLGYDEKEVLDRYKGLLKLCSRPEFADGQTYDLCFCNMDSAGFNPDRHFVFLRHFAEKKSLVVCNFSNVPARISVEIPLLSTARTIEVQAFDYTVTEL